MVLKYYSNTKKLNLAEGSWFGDVGLSMWPGFAKNLPLCEMVELSGSVVRCLQRWFLR